MSKISKKNKQTKKNAKGFGLLRFLLSQSYVGKLL